MTLDPKSSYYDKGGIETIAIIRAKLTSDQFDGFLLGNIIKYACRANYKGTFERDIEKVRHYSKLLADPVKEESCSDIVEGEFGPWHLKDQSGE